MPDSDPDTDSENVFPAALSGSYAKAPGFAGGYLLLFEPFAELVACFSMHNQRPDLLH
jgi:hypothetical protein